MPQIKGLVLAGNYEEYIYWMKQHGFGSHEYRYVSPNPEVIMGFHAPVFGVGTWQENCTKLQLEVALANGMFEPKGEPITHLPQEHVQYQFDPLMDKYTAMAAEQLAYKAAQSLNDLVQAEYEVATKAKAMQEIEPLYFKDTLPYFGW